MKRNILIAICTISVLFTGISQHVAAQSRRDKEQTYVLETPYEVTKITPPQGKKIKIGRAHV